MDTSTVPDTATARAKVTSGDLDVALIPGSTGGYTAIVDEGLPTDLRSIIDSLVRQQAINSALRAQGVDPATLGEAAARATLKVDAVHPPDPDRDQRTALAFVAMLLMFFQLLMFGLYVAMGKRGKDRRFSGADAPGDRGPGQAGRPHL